MRKMTFKGFVNDGAGFVFLSALARAASALSSFIAITKVSAASFGQYSYIQTTALMIGAVLSLSLQNSLIKPIANRKLGDVTTPAALTTGMLYALTCGGVVLLATSFVETRPVYLGAIVSTVVFLTSGAFFQSALIANNKSSFSAYGALASSASLLFLLLFFPYNSADQLLMAYICSNILGFLVLFLIVLRRFSFEVHFNEMCRFWREILIHSLNYAFKAGIGTVVSMFSVWYVQYCVKTDGGSIVNASFSAGMQFYNLFLFLPLIITPILVSKIKDSVAFDDITMIALRWFLACIALMIFALVLVKIMLPNFPQLFVDSEFTIIIFLLSGTISTCKLIVIAYCVIVLLKNAELIASVSSALSVMAVCVAFPPNTAVGGAVCRLLGDAVNFLVLSGVVLASAHRTKTLGRLL